MDPAYQQLSTSQPISHPLNAKHPTNVNQSLRHPLDLPIPSQETADENPTLPFPQSTQVICHAQVNCNKPGYILNGMHVHCTPKHIRVNHRSMCMGFHYER